jgi:ankyrin repeat protein
VEVVRLLLESGADANRPDRSGRTQLYHASANDQLELVQLLVKHGAMVDKADKAGGTPLYQSSSAGYLIIAKVYRQKLPRRVS